MKQIKQVSKLFFCTLTLMLTLPFSQAFTQEEGASLVSPQANSQNQPGCWKKINEFLGRQHEASTSGTGLKKRVANFPPMYSANTSARAVSKPLSTCGEKMRTSQDFLRHFQ